MGGRLRSPNEWRHSTGRLQRNDVEMIFRVTHPGRKQERLVMAWTLRYFFRYEVEHLLARCGFRVEALYGSFDGAPLGDEFAGDDFRGREA